MASNRILSSKQVNKLQVNRLDAQAIRSDNIRPDSPSYLFSAVFNNTLFLRNSQGGTLTFTRKDVDSIIQFSDRPFRQTYNIDYDTFISLFSTSGINSFEKDPPNAVLVHEEEQRTYVVKLKLSDSNSATFSLELLPGESHNLNTVSGRMNLFVDQSSESYVTSITYILNSVEKKAHSIKLYTRNGYTVKIKIGSTINKYKNSLEKNFQGIYIDNNPIPYTLFNDTLTLTKKKIEAETESGSLIINIKVQS